jgi:hypothetical protein
MLGKDVDNLMHALRHKRVKRNGQKLANPILPFEVEEMPHLHRCPQGVWMLCRQTCG